MIIKIIIFYNVIDIFSKYAWSVQLKTKTGSEAAKAFESVMNKNHPKKHGLMKALNYTIKFLINY